MKADTLFVGNIITMDAQGGICEAMAVKDGIVEYVGSREGADKLCDENTKVVDFGGTVYPGAIEAHCHGDLAGMRLALQAELSVGTTMGEYVDITRRFVDNNPDFGEYRGAGWVVREQLPTAAMLDEVSAEKPILLVSTDCHSIWFNTPAMKKYGITKEAAAKWGPEVIRTYPDGTPTGYVSEGPVQQLLSKTEYTHEQMRTAYLAWQDYAFSHGLTAVMHAGVTEQSAGMYDELVRSGLWKLRTYGFYLVDENETDYVACVRKARELADRYNSEYFRIVGIKIFMDGVVEAHTAWTCEGYEDAPEDTGVKRMCDPERVTEIYREAQKSGFMVHAHVIGDGAVHFALDCIEAAQPVANGQNRQAKEYRHALAHLQLVKPEDIKRLCDLKCVAVVPPLWVPKDPIFYNGMELPYLGKERADHQYPIRSFLDGGSVIAFHSDFPVSPVIDIPNSIYTAVTRNYPDYPPESCRVAGEGITRQQALAGLTTGPAYSVGDENHIGALKPGSAANIMVYDRNFLTDDLKEAARAQLLSTYVDGREVYHR